MTVDEVKQIFDKQQVENARLVLERRFGLRVTLEDKGPHWSNKHYTIYTPTNIPLLQVTLFDRSGELIIGSMLHIATDQMSKPING